MRGAFVLESHYEYSAIIKMDHDPYSISFWIHKTTDSC